MVKNFAQNQPVLLAAPERDEAAAAAPAAPRPAPARGFSTAAVSFALVVSAFWVGAWGAYLVGYWGVAGLAALPLQQMALFGAATVLPPFLFAAIALLAVRAHAMGQSTKLVLAAADRLFAADETAARGAARLGRAVRHELDALNAGLDGAFQRLRALETALENQIGALDEAGARAEVRTQAIAQKLTQESTRLEQVSDSMSDAAARASETMAGRTAQLKSTIETAEGALKMATQSLDVQAAGFRAATNAAAEAPHQAAIELDKQSKKIETVADAAMSRAEFVLARHERHRAAMAELLLKLKDEGEQFETALSQQRTGMEQAIDALHGEAKNFESVTGDAERHLELIMANAASRVGQLSTGFAREAERLKDVSDAAADVMTALVNAMRDAGTGAQALIGESAAQARHDAKNLVGEAMAECGKLLKTAGEMSTEAAEIRLTLAKTIEDLERHLVRLPGLAQDEARRVRQLVASETDQILDISARTLSTIHARASRGTQTPPPPGAPVQAVPEGDGLRGLARKLTRPKQAPGSKNWDMRELLAAADTGEEERALKPGNAAALGALELALADMALDLGAIGTAQPGDEDWKRYLSGDRAVFARRLSAAIDDKAVDRITALYREDTRFHDAADAYLGEFESLLAKAREGDGDGLLVSTILSADTGKIYLAIAYALGRL